MRLGCTCDRVRKGEPFAAARDCPHCWAFWHDAAVNRARGGTGAVPVRRAKPRASVPTRGPGTELKKLLASFGVTDEVGCSCKSRAAMMDSHGVGWCKVKRDTIAGWLKEEAERRTWFERLKAGAKMVAAGFVPNPLDVYGSLVDEAIRRAEVAARPPFDLGAVGRRHLAYFLLPVAGNGVWRKGVDQLRERWPLFTGRKVIAVMTGDGVKEQGTGRELPLDTPTTVRAYLPADCEVIVLPNDPGRWELAAWYQLWGAVLAGASDSDAALYAHAKGVTRPHEATPHRWAELLYTLSLDHWKETEESLRRHPISGPLLKPGRFFQSARPGVVGMERSAFHFSGNFWWARVGPLRDRLARVPVPVDPWGAEAWTGIAYRLEEAGTVFTDAQPFDLYKPADMDRVERAYQRWKGSHPVTVPAANKQMPTGSVRLSIIVPTSGRDTLSRCLASITSQLLPGDELILKRDASGDWGATPRAEAIPQARGTHLLFMDDDDVYTAGSLAAVRQAIGLDPSRVHVFRMDRGAPFHDHLPRDREVRVGNVSTQMFAVPNDARLAPWGTRYEGDFDFLAATLANHGTGPVWHDATITTWRPA